MITAIQSRDNPSFKQLMRWLRDPAVLRRETPFAVAEGFHLLAELVQWPALRWHSLWTTEAMRLHPDWLAVAADLPACQHVQLSEALFGQLSNLVRAQGPIIVFERPATPVWPPLADRMMLLLDGVQDPGNMGNLLRTAAAAGVGSVWLTEDCAWPWQPKVIRAGMGAHRALQLHTVSPELLAQSAPQGYASWQICLTTLAASAQPLHGMAFGAEPCLWVFGHEGQGVREPWLRHFADHPGRREVFIEMAAGIESLNVAVAAGIALFEQRRQLSSI